MTWPALGQQIGSCTQFSASVEMAVPETGVSDSGTHGAAPCPILRHTRRLLALQERPTWQPPTWRPSAARPTSRRWAAFLFTAAEAFPLGASIKPGGFR